VVDYPITATGVTVHRSLVSGITSGAILIDDLTAHYGAVTRGIVLAGGGVETKALYSTTARLKTGATSTALTVTSNTVGVTTGADPIFVTSPLGVTATSTRAQGVVIRWESGDRADVQLDIVDSAGTVVRALGRARYDSGAQTLTWDGKSTAGAIVPAGAYRVRLMAFDRDGARATVYGAFIRSS
jgi:flagellar hook assembly protein FlgD